MATVKATLRKGLNIGGTSHKVAVLREYTAGDIIDAVDAAEKLVQTPDGPVLLASPARVDIELLCRQVVKIGDHPGPLALVEIRKLSGVDLAKLQKMAALLDKGAAQAANQRGRGDGSQGAD